MANSLHRVLKAAVDALGTKKACIYMLGLFLTFTSTPPRRKCIRCKRTWVKYNKGVGDAPLVARPRRQTWRDGN